MPLLIESQPVLPTPGSFQQLIARIERRKSTLIALFTAAAIFVFLILRFGINAEPRLYYLPLQVTLVFGGIPLVYDLLKKLLKRQFGSDLLGGISIITSVL